MQKKKYFDSEEEEKPLEGFEQNNVVHNVLKYYPFQDYNTVEVMTICNIICILMMIEIANIY